MRDRLVLAGSTSKAYAMTGWRCGWLAAPKPVVSAANALQSHSTSNVNSITQKAAMAALTGPQQCVTDMLDEYKTAPRSGARAGWPRSRACAARCRRARSIVFPDISDFLSPDRLRTSLDFADGLLEGTLCGDDRRRSVRRAGLSPAVLRHIAGAVAGRH